MKALLLSFLLLCCGPWWSQAQQRLSLPQMQQQAAAQLPLLKRKALAAETAKTQTANLNNNFLPQLSVNAQASWQSDVTALNVGNIPGFPKIEPLSKDQYRATLDVNQLIYDGGINRRQKEMTHLQQLLREEEVNIALQQLKERINNLYLNVMLIDEQQQQLNILFKDIEAGIAKVKAQVQYGTAFRSNLALMEAEQLKAQQRRIELQDDREGLLSVLALYTGQQIPADAVLEAPEVPAMVSANDISRPELQLYQLQDSLYQLQAATVTNKLQPRISAFANAGYGRPGLNMLKNEFAPFATTGIRLSWNLSNFYNKNNDKIQAAINRKDIQAQQENFVQQTTAQLRQQQSAISKLQALIGTDNQIIALKKQVKEAAKAQLENGVITASDYLREVNAEDQARHALALHQLQLVQALLNYSTTAGK